MQQKNVHQAFSLVPSPQKGGLQLVHAVCKFIKHLPYINYLYKTSTVYVHFTKVKSEDSML